MRRLLVLIGLILLASLSARAQTFSSGSTGADGALNLATMNCPGGFCTVQLPESGVLNYTTVNIPAGKSLAFARNSRNTPVYMLAQGSVTIEGGINISATSETCGVSVAGSNPGGFRGGQPGQPGFGPGGGQTNSPSGTWIGPLSLVPIIGGSGGAGHVGPFFSFAGGDGGGAIVIASSTTIALSGSISANGGVHGHCSGSGFPGSGGAIRLVANSVNVSGSFSACYGNALCGVVRLEAPVAALTFTGSSTPPAVLSSINPAVVSSNPPVLAIVSVGGFAVPSYAGQRFDTVDLLLPNQLADPIAVLVQANNIPVGTSVSVGIVNGSPNATSTSSTLQGTFASSTASPTISNLNRTAVTYLLASATFDPPAGSGFSNPKGANYVEKIRLEALIGAKPKYIFLRKDGTVISPDKLSPQFLAQFGQ